MENNTDVTVSLKSLIATKTRQPVKDLEPYVDRPTNRSGWLVTFENGVTAFAALKLSLQANGALDDPE